MNVIQEIKDEIRSALRVPSSRDLTILAALFLVRQPCLVEAQQKLQDRAKAQKAAIEDGMTLAEAVPGSQVMVQSLKGAPKLKKLLGQEGFDTGAIVQVEKRDDSGTLHINLKGYHVSLSIEDASKICVKPI